MSDFSRLLEMALASDAPGAMKALGEPEPAADEKGKSGAPQQRSGSHPTQAEHASTEQHATGRRDR
jgi:hypothetical protein